MAKFKVVFVLLGFQYIEEKKVSHSFGIYGARHCQMAADVISEWILTFKTFSRQEVMSVVKFLCPCR